MNRWLVHGWNTRGEQFDRLKVRYIDHGLEAQDLDYGRSIGWYMTRQRTKTAARILAQLSRPGDIAIGHSNGCNVIAQSANDFGAHFSLVQYLSPALDNDTPLGQNVRFCYVYSTPNDMVVRLSKFLPFSPWGDMGYAGYKGKDNRVRNKVCPSVKGHSDWFNRPSWLFQMLRNDEALAEKTT